MKKWGGLLGFGIGKLLKNFKPLVLSSIARQREVMKSGAILKQAGIDPEEFLNKK